MRVLTKEADRFGNTEVARTHLAKTSPSYVGHLLLLHEAEWGNWGRLEETIRTGHSPVTRHVFETDPELGRTFCRFWIASDSRAGRRWPRGWSLAKPGPSLISGEVSARMRSPFAPSTLGCARPSLTCRRR